MKNLEFSNSEETLEALRLATEAADLGIWDLDVQTGELRWSERCKQIFGVPNAGTLSLEDFLELLHPDERDRIQAAMSAALDPAGSREYDVEYRVCRPDQEQRYLQAKGRAFFDVVGGRLQATRFMGTVMDRTDQKLSQAALVHAEQLAVTGRLAVSIAHEISNPLDGVTNLLFLLRDEVKSETGRQYVQEAEMEIGRVADIASNTLRFYRDPKEPSEVDVGGLLHSVLTLFQGRMTVNRVALDVRCESGLCVWTEQGQLRQVLVNLVSNAIDAMPQGGLLRLRCQRGSGKAAADRGVRITVADNGTGMSSEVQRRIFDPFYTTKGSSGTGLGLWLSREIARKQGYRLSVRSRIGKGTVFRLEVPLH